MVTRYLLLLGLLVLVFSELALQPQWYWQDLCMSRDQQGQWYFRQKQYAQAALRFEHPGWRASALYSAQQFRAAAQLWSQQSGPVALYNRANALAQLSDYAAAADSYKLALQLQPKWPQARENLELVVALKRKAKPLADYSDQGKAKLDADDFVFDDEQSLRLQQSQDTETIANGGLSSAQIQALWLRRLQSRPADFLRLKFRYQLQRAESWKDEVQP